MSKRVVLNLFSAIFLISVAGCASLGPAGHKYFMKGQILEVVDREAYICIGMVEGAKPEQEFMVYRYVKEDYAQAAYKKQPQKFFNYKREQVGAIKIRQVVDEHFARADVLRGDVKEHDVAELSP